YGRSRIAAAAILSLRAEGGIRYRNLTGVQSCARPISVRNSPLVARGIANRQQPRGCSGLWGMAEIQVQSMILLRPIWSSRSDPKIGRASCRERVEITGGGRSQKQHTEQEDTDGMASRG